MSDVLTLEDMDSELVVITLTAASYVKKEKRGIDCPNVGR